MRIFRHKPRKKILLIIGGFFLLGTILTIFFVFPERWYFLLLFFSLFFLTLFYLLSFLLNHTRRALFISLAVTLWLFLRSLGLRHWLYPVLLVTLFTTLEIYFLKNSD